MMIRLPGSLANARDVATVGELSEADAAEIEISDVTTVTTAAPTSAHEAARELRLPFGFADLSFSCHMRTFISR